MEKGNCYRDAYRALVNRKGDPGWVVVHGVCTGRGPIAGVRFGHAWLEYRVMSPGGKTLFSLAFDPSADVTLLAERYRALGEVTDCVEYTLEELHAHHAAFLHYGPFDPVIAAAVHG